MNMRQHKRWVMARQLFPWALVFAGRRILAREAVPFIPERGVVLRAEELPTFRCVKVNGGDIVAEFDSREEALALMLKHAKQRKAKLQVLNTGTGELEIFSEEEAVI